VSDFPDGLAFVDLAPITDPSLVLPAIAQAIGLREHGSDAPLERIRAFLRARRVLLVVDNVEHILAAAPAVTEILSHAPAARVLATSRIPLQLSG